MRLALPAIKKRTADCVWRRRVCYQDLGLACKWRLRVGNIHQGSGSADYDAPRRVQGHRGVVLVHRVWEQPLERQLAGLQAAGLDGRRDLEGEHAAIVPARAVCSCFVWSAEGMILDVVYV